jgi:hypothetical protein
MADMNRSARTTESRVSVIDGAPESTSITPSFPIEAVMFPLRR